MHNPEDRSFFGHPRGLGYIAFTEAWERFSYYGMQSLLVLYMVTGCYIPDTSSTSPDSFRFVTFSKTFIADLLPCRRSPPQFRPLHRPCLSHTDRRRIAGRSFTRSHPHDHDRRTAHGSRPISDSIRRHLSRRTDVSSHRCRLFQGKPRQPGRRSLRHGGQPASGRVSRFTTSLSTRVSSSRR